MKKIEERLLNQIKRYMLNRPEHYTSTRLSDNTTCIYSPAFMMRISPTIFVKLYSTRIVEINLLGDLIDIKFNNGGWVSSTTKSRMNAILSLFTKEKISQKNYSWYFMGNEFKTIENFTIDREAFNLN